MLKNSKYIFLIITMFLFTTNVVKAESCDTADIERLKEIANNVDISYEYVGNKKGKDKNTFLFTMSNLNSEIYIIEGTYKYYDFYDGEVFSFEKTYGNRTFLIYSNECDVELRKLDISIEGYNEFAFYSECNNISSKDLKVCDINYDGKLTYETFKDEIEKYNEENKTNIKQIIKNHKILFISAPITILLIIIAIVLIKKISFKVRGKLE